MTSKRPRASAARAGCCSQRDPGPGKSSTAVRFRSSSNGPARTASKRPRRPASRAAPRVAPSAPGRPRGRRWRAAAREGIGRERRRSARGKRRLRRRVRPLAWGPNQLPARARAATPSSSGPGRRPLGPVAKGAARSESTCASVESGQGPDVPGRRSFDVAGFGTHGRNAPADDETSPCCRFSISPGRLPAGSRHRGRLIPEPASARTTTGSAGSPGRLCRGHQQTKPPGVLRAGPPTAAGSSPRSAPTARPAPRQGRTRPAKPRRRKLARKAPTTRQRGWPPASAHELVPSTRSSQQPRNHPSPRSPFASASRSPLHHKLRQAREAHRSAHARRTASTACLPRANPARRERQRLRRGRGSNHLPVVDHAKQARAAPPATSGEQASRSQGPTRNPVPAAAPGASVPKVVRRA